MVLFMLVLRCLKAIDRESVVMHVGFKRFCVNYVRLCCYSCGFQRFCSLIAHTFAAVRVGFMLFSVNCVLAVWVLIDLRRIVCALCGF